MPFSALHDELVNDPAGMGYAGKSYQQMADLMNAPTRFNGRAMVSADSALFYMVKIGAWGHLRLLAENTATPTAQRVALINFRDTLLQLQDIRTVEASDYAAYGALLDGVVAAGVITPLQRSALVSMADTFVSRALEMRIAGTYVPDPSAADIEAALNETGD